MLAKLSLVAAALLVLGAGSTCAQGSLTVYPTRTVLKGKSARQRLLVTEVVNGGAVDRTGEARFESLRPDVVRVSADGIVTPVGDGAGTILVKCHGKLARASVQALDGNRLLPATFEKDVEPILARAGCNAGSCHGKSRGQNGFQLSLLGFDPDFDFAAITQEARGRRIFPAAPDHSLLLRKAAALMPHGGGTRLMPEDVAFAQLRQWIAAGTPRTPKDEPALERITVEPSERILANRAQQQLVVMAHYRDGSTRDVTHLAMFLSNESGLAAVDADGRIKAGPLPGEAALRPQARCAERDSRRVSADRHTQRRRLLLRAHAAAGVAVRQVRRHPLDSSQPGQSRRRQSLHDDRRAAAHPGRLRCVRQLPPEHGGSRLARARRAGGLAELRVDPRHQFEARKGRPLAFKVESQSLDFDVEPVLRLTDRAGKQLARAEAPKLHADAVLSYRPSQDGTYLLEVQDLHGAAGRRHVYRLRAAAEVPDFALTLAADRFTVAAGTALSIPVAIERRGGFAEDVAIHVEGLPTGATAKPVTAKAKDKTVQFQLTATMSGVSAPIRVLGKAAGPSGTQHAALATAAELERRTDELWLTVRKGPVR